jgi:hypothetical protein
MAELPGAAVERRAPEGDVCASIVAAVSEATGAENDSLEPLYAAVEPSVLRSLCQTRQCVEGHVTFTWAGCEVTVHSDRRVLVREQTGGRPAD